MSIISYDLRFLFFLFAFFYLQILSDNARWFKKNGKTYKDERLSFFWSLGHVCVFCHQKDDNRTLEKEFFFLKSSPWKAIIEVNIYLLFEQSLLMALFVFMFSFFWTKIIRKYTYRMYNEIIITMSAASSIKRN